MSPPSSRHQTISTGMASLDQVLDGLRIGDNVVWRVADIEDYRRFVIPFVAAALEAKRDIIYLRFGSQAPLLEEGPGIQVVRIDALRGFEVFVSHVWRLIEEYGRGAFYICDCLTDLLEAWATEHMVGNFFRVVCPFLYELDTVAWFALHPAAHSPITLSRIRETTQVMIDIHHAGNELQVQPIKVWQRQSPTMFLPHRLNGDRFEPVIDSSDATRLQALIEQQRPGHQPLLDCWDQLFLDAAEALDSVDLIRQREMLDRPLPLLISRDDRILALARRYLTLEDLLAIRARMIGSGYIGGKAVGMLLARAILLRDDPAVWNHKLEPHDSIYLGSDVYYAFLVHNGLWPALMGQRTDAGFFSEAPDLRNAILEGALPPETKLELESVLDHFGQYPMLVRSSSLLEDGFGNAFAGKYDSVFLINQGDPAERLARLEDAIRTVYASTMSMDALTYRHQRGLQHQEEPMALLLQRVNGRYHDHYYFPDAAGVGISRNTFAWDRDMDPAAGLVRLVMGLGTRAVDRIEGDHACVMALDHPLRRPFRNRDETYRFSQHLVDVMDVNGPGLSTIPLGRLMARQRDIAIERLAELDREATERSRRLGDGDPVWRLTFAPLVKRDQFVPLVRKMLGTLEQAYRHPVDVEFTVHLDSDGDPRVNVVQCRPLTTLGQSETVEIPTTTPADRLYFRTDGHFMGGSMNLSIDRVIAVSGHHYAQLGLQEKYELAGFIGQLCREAPPQSRILLIGPGRWGTSSPELGVPVRFADINRVAVLAEVAEMGSGMVPDLSFGSHFFLDLVESGIGYVALFPGQPGTDYRPDWLHAQPGMAIGDDHRFTGVVTVHDTRAAGLTVTADVVSQQLVCAACGG